MKKKYFESDKEGYIRIYPTIHDTAEKSKLNFLIKLLKRLKKGY